MSAGARASLSGSCSARPLLRLLFPHPPRPARHEAHAPGRPLRAIAAQDRFVVAVLGAAVGYGVMVLVMTATPLAMHAHAHSFPDTACVIEWHVLGMVAPSVVTGPLNRRLGW